MRHISTKCPHCGADCRSIRTIQISGTYREVTFLCTNDDCGYRFVASITPVRTLQPSMHPNPTVHIPGATRMINTLQKNISSQTWNSSQDLVYPAQCVTGG